MKRTYSTNRIVVFSFIVISFATLSAGLFMFFTNADVKKEVPKVSSNIIQTPRPTILPSVYPACDGFGEDKKWGLIDAKGDFVVEPKYDEIADFQENGYAVVKNIIDSKNDYKQLVGLIDSTGKEVLPLIYSSISDFKEGLSSLTVEGSKEVKVINEKLEKVFSLKADYIEDFHDGVAVYSKTVKDEYLSGYVDKSG
ncbi:MAG: WG repeat-containing protein, partial [Clostridia bacterium]